MSSIRVSISASTGTYGDRTLASATLDVPIVGIDGPNVTPAEIDAIEDQIGNRIAQVRRELATQIATARATAEKVDV